MGTSESALLERQVTESSIGHAAVCDITAAVAFYQRVLGDSKRRIMNGPDGDAGGNGSRSPRGGFGPRFSGAAHAQTKVSMVAATPKARLVKLAITAQGEESFSIGGSSRKATHYPS